MAVRQLTPLRVLATPQAQDPRASVEIYRPFFLAGILSVLTAGCTLGAIALLGIALNASFTSSAWTPYILAHANSQLYGWVGFFVMGFALQQHAPRQSRKAHFLKLATWALSLMAVGIGLRFAAEPLAVTNRDIALPLGIVAGICQIAAVGLFIFNAGFNRFRREEGPMWQIKLVFSALLWWMIVAIAEPFFFAYSHQPGGAGVQFVAQWFPPYREAQFLGFVTMIIFGVSYVKMNSCFGAKPAHRKFGEAGLIFWNIGLIMRMAGWVIGYRSGLEQMTLYTLGGWTLAAAAAMLIYATRLFERTEFTIPAHKFVRGAMTWLLISGVLLILEPLHLSLTGQQFSHAYIGAVRHAVTVGFISQMILGVGMHVVATMNDIPRNAQAQLWSVFVLLNLGNLLRVGLEIGTDYSARSFLPMGFTGFIELLALFIWAVHVARPMLKRAVPAVA